MSVALKQRARIARVRRLQHGIAASSAAEAVGQLRNLEVSRDRLSQIRNELSASEGMTNGAFLSAAGELAMRLDTARLGLATNIEAARAQAATREQARVSARKSQESAERLESKAMRAAVEAADQRLNKVAPRRDRKGTM